MNPALLSSPFQIARSAHECPFFSLILLLDQSLIAFMKKRLLMVAVLAALSVSAFGQGQVILANNSASLVRIESGDFGPLFQLVA